MLRGEVHLQRTDPKLGDLLEELIKQATGRHLSAGGTDHPFEDQTMPATYGIDA